jgi:O-antigen ligase
MTGLLNHDEGMGWSAGVHNVYLQISVELGLIPGILFIVLLVKLILRMKSIKVSSQQSDVSILAEAAACALVGFAVEAFFSPVAYNFYFYILAAIAIAIKEVAGRNPPVQIVQTFDHELMPKYIYQHVTPR